MSKASVRWRSYGLTLEVPDAVARRVRRRAAAPAPAMLEVSPTVPQLRLDRHEGAGERFVAEFREVRERLCKLSQDSSLSERVAAIHWYHTLELPGDIVTPGLYDHRPLVPHYGLPADLTGKRALDIGTWDGFWAFELERRGADVTAADLDRVSSVDLPSAERRSLEETGVDMEIGLGFKLAKELLGSKVNRVVRSVYELDPADIGTFDLVHIGDVLLHLENPLAALRRIRSVTSGTAMIVDCYDPGLARPGVKLTRYRGGWSEATWWLPSLDTLAQMVLDAGFADVEVRRVYRLCPAGKTTGYWHAVLVAR